VAALLVAAPLFADGTKIEPIDIGFRERTGRSLLFLDVEGIDKQGQPMLGLKKEDFKIRVNYVWRKIYSVDDLCPCGETEGPTGDPEADAAAAARLELARTPPHFILYFDFSQMQEAGREQSAAEARRWARDVMKPDDRVMVVAYASGAGLRTLSEFTSDPDAVVEAIDAGANAPDLVDEFPAGKDDRQALCDTGAISCYAVGRQEYRHARHSLETLRNFLTELDAVSERKTLLLFHENASIFPGRLYAEGSAYWPQSAWDRLDDLRDPGTEARRTRSLRRNSELTPDLLELSQEVGGSATASRTAVYPLACGSAAMWTVNLGANLADATGGDYNRRPVDLGNLLDEAGRRCACIYRIGLEMDEKRRSLVLRTKVRVSGYSLPSRYHVQYLTDADRWMRKAQLVLANPESWRELEVGAALVPLRAGGKRWDARVEVGIDLGDLFVGLTDDDAQAAEWEVAALLTDGEGNKHWEMLGVYRASPGEDGRVDSLVLHGKSLENLNPGRYELRAFVHDRMADTFGAARFEIELPEPGAPGLAGPIAQRPVSPHLFNPLPLRGKELARTKGKTRTAEGPLPLGGDPFVPRGRLVRFLTQICSEGAIELRSVVRHEGSERSFEEKSETVGDGGGCRPVVQTIETRGLEPGRYAYEIEWDGAAPGARATFEVIAD